MQLNVETIAQAFASMPAWEITAVIFGIAYVLLAAKESLWTWFFAFFGTLIYTILFWEGALLSSSLLNFYYMLMAVYGFVLWRGNKQSQELEISTWSLKKNSITIAFGLLLSVVLGFLFDSYTEAKFVYLDTFVMVFSVIATWMLANKVLENWLYWVVIDSAAIVLYWQSGYVATVVLFTLYVVLAFYGYTSWRKVFSENG
ncbi:MAG: Predicted thiamin transporter PnuT [uncultured Sulfurovum sp.]|uniref:Nicotinamide riboside transporter PnuC n=1 Tax=uncultured Sulfurovum sp. TaxID=269237 RepID=A0A6S6SEI7_9BACT|nr:MAG: Predicted thiamin transporter PnuT [uncultured Sulfurovum sp.]